MALYFPLKDYIKILNIGKSLLAKKETMIPNEIF